MKIVINRSKAMWVPPEIRRILAKRRLATREAARADRCGARTRSGNPCQAKKVAGRKRCKFHGGLSTGPKTDAGKAAVARNLPRRAPKPPQ